MSIGNVSQAVDFDKNPLTLVLGENLDQGGDDAGSRNGVGKSCILNALSYVLYGRALTKIKRNNLINNINEKNMLVTLNFEKDGIKYRIERGRSPNVLKLYIDDKIVEIDESQGDSRNTQTDIDNILVMSHDLFTHIIALNTYTDAFLSMRVHDQRTIIEQLLGITILSQKAEMLKTEIKTVKEPYLKKQQKLMLLKRATRRLKKRLSLQNYDKQHGYENEIMMLMISKIPLVN